MSIESEINQIKEERTQLNAAIDCRNHMKGLYSSIRGLDDKVNYYKNNTGFDTIPTETKTALNRIYQKFLQLKAAIEDDPAFDILINY